MKMKKLVVLLFAAGVMASPLANATNGYFSHGYGMKAKGMGGAATAMASDTYGGANNPASMVWVGDRLDVGVDWFSPIRSASRTGSAAGGNVDFVEDSGSNNFFVPEFGYNHMINSNMSLGITVYGNGGMNTSYKSGTSVASCARMGGAPAPSNPLCGGGELGVNLEQLIIAPTLAYKFNDSHSIGVTPMYVFQHFRANGLQAFGAISANGAALTNMGHDRSTGFGVRLGWQGKVTNAVTLGATYSPKINMSKFSKYAGLFAEQGDFDIPMNWNLGVAFDATPAVKVALDYEHIAYGGVKSISNSSVNPSMPAALMGNNAGLGFGWSDVNVIKLGMEYKYSDALTLRAGINHGSNPIQSADVTFNILAPGVITDHYTLGATYGLGKDSEITVAYMHAQEKSVSGTTNPLYFPAGGTDSIKMYQNSLGIAYGVKF
ncbi:MAG: outer membrane protein transport protein [Gallionella sp.]|nr:outer membrane protein transport protein [Gallionella sp.]